MRFDLKKLRILWADRAVQTGILALVLIITMGSLRPKESFGLYPDEYWMKKASWHQCADMVLAGDSRVLISLAPCEMVKIIGPERIYNYGFGSAWYSPEYLQAIEDVLDPRSNSKTIVLGISPHSLTERDSETSNFFENHKLSKHERFIQMHFGSLLYFFQPLSFHEIWPVVFPSLAKSHTVRKFFGDGWISVHKEPGRIDHELKKYHGFYQQRQVDEQNIKNLLSAVSKWTSDNISVYGFIPPSCKEMYEMEGQISGFNEKDFVARFENAGGVWIDTDPGAYYSFDGSHLQDDAALQFTHDFVFKMVELQEGTASLTVKQ
jgi:hypothetical protein